MSCFHLSKGALGNKNGLWVLALLGWWKSTACLEVGLQRGFARETLGEPSTFQLWQTGHNTIIVLWALAIWDSITLVDLWIQVKEPKFFRAFVQILFKYLYENHPILDKNYSNLDIQIILVQVLVKYSFKTFLHKLFCKFGQNSDQISNRFS